MPISVGVKVSVCILIFISYVTRTDAASIKVAIATPGNFVIVPFRTAEAKGYYREEALEVQLVATGAPTGTLAHIAGNVQFSTLGVNSLNAAIRGAPLRIVFSSFHKPMFWLYTKSDIRRIDELKGKRVAVTGLASTQTFHLQDILQQHGLVMRDVTILGAGTGANSHNALLSGLVDAAMLSPPYTFSAKEKGFRELVSLMNLDLVELQGAIVTNESLQTDIDIIRKFVRGTLKGLLYARNNRDGAIPIVMNSMKVAKDQAQKIYDDLQPAMTTSGSINDQSMRELLRRTLERQEIQETPRLEKFFDFSIVTKLRAELERSGWRPGP